jgi:hypothetical protein
MAINIGTQDLDNYPGNSKTVTIDVASLVPTGYEGDEQIVLRIYTTAYSDNTARTAIQDLYITEAKSGWIKSSGFKGSVFQLDSTHTTFRIKLDTTVSGWDGTGYYNVVLDHDNGANLPGDQVAADMEDKIRAIPDGMQWNAADTGFMMSYKNCSVEFDNGKFKIISGSISDSYTGSTRSSVTLASGTSNDCLTWLGFDLPTSSEVLAGTQVREAQLTQNYPYMGDYTKIYTSGGTGATSGDAMAITDGTNTEYFLVESTGPATGEFTIISGTLSNMYTAQAAKVQLLRMNDADFEPTSPYGNVDAIARYGIKNMVNQIDYSS